MLTFGNRQASEHQHHRVPTVDGVAAIRVLAIDRQTEAGHQRKGALGNDERGGAVDRLGAAIVGGAGHGQHGDVHGDGAHEVEHRHYDEDAAHYNEPIF